MRRPFIIFSFHWKLVKGKEGKNIKDREAKKVKDREMKLKRRKRKKRGKKISDFSAYNFHYLSVKIYDKVIHIIYYI